MSSATKRARRRRSSSVRPKKSCNVVVAIRFRPHDEAPENMYLWNLRSDTEIQEQRTGKVARVFRFDHIFAPQTTNREVFERSSACEIVDCTMRGINGTIFAYGQTNSGKTHTLFGPPDEPGLVFAAIERIFALVKTQYPNDIFVFRVQMMEIYNEHLFDLFQVKHGKKEEVTMRLGKDGRFVPVNVIEKVVSSVSQVKEVIALALANRAVGVSDLNAHSSRSHCIFRFIMEHGSRQRGRGVKVSELNIVDLAGSEIYVHDGGTTKNRETRYINVSLTELKNVIIALSKKSAQKKKGKVFVPYRNSTLTKFLKGSLGGNARTLVICTASPQPVHADMTRSTLNFGARAQKIVNAPKVNVVGEDETLLKEYRERIEELEQKVAEFDQLQEDKARLQEQVNELQSQLAEVKRQEREQDEEEIRRLTSCMVTATTQTPPPLPALQAPLAKRMVAVHRIEEQVKATASAGTQAATEHRRAVSTSATMGTQCDLLEAKKPDNHTLKRQTEALRRQRHQLERHVQSAQAHLILRRQRSAVLKNCWHLSQTVRRLRP